MGAYLVAGHVILTDRFGVIRVLGLCACVDRTSDAVWVEGRAWSLVGIARAGRLALARLVRLACARWITCSDRAATAQKQRQQHDDDTSDQDHSVHLLHLHTLTSDVGHSSAAM